MFDRTSRASSRIASTLICAAVAALAACGGQAHAATLSKNYVSDDGKVFQVTSALAVEKVAGAVNVTAANGTTYGFADATGAVFNKILAAPEFPSTYFQVPGTLAYVNTVTPLYVICYAGSTQTYIAYAGSVAKVYNDNCALVNAIKAASN